MLPSRPRVRYIAAERQSCSDLLDSDFATGLPSEGLERVWRKQHQHLNLHGCGARFFVIPRSVAGSGSGGPADEDTDDHHGGDPQADLPAQIVLVTLGHISPQAIQGTVIFGCHRFHPFLRRYQFTFQFSDGQRIVPFFARLHTLIF